MAANGSYPTQSPSGASTYPNTPFMQTPGMGYTNNAHYAKNAHIWNLHPRFDPRRQEHHYSFALAPLKWQGQMEECLRYTRALLSTYTSHFELHPHYNNDEVLKWWDIWIIAPVPEALLVQIRNLEGCLYIFRSHPLNITVNLGASWIPRWPLSYLQELNVQAPPLPSQNT